MTYDSGLWIGVEHGVIHPDSPVGAGGLGHFRIPGPLGINIGGPAQTPHHDAPALRHQSLDSVILQTGSPAPRAEAGSLHGRTEPLTPESTDLKGWFLTGTIHFQIDEDVPKPLHEAIRKAARHWNRSLDAAGIPLHYKYHGNPTQVFSGRRVHRFVMEDLLFGGRGANQGHLVGPRDGPIAETSHAITNREGTVFTETVRTRLHSGGMLHTTKPGPIRAVITPSGGTALVQSNPTNPEAANGQPLNRMALTPYALIDMKIMVGVVVHEIGHAMGLDHPPTPAPPGLRSVMFGPGADIDRTVPLSGDIARLLRRARNEGIHLQTHAGVP